MGPPHLLYSCLLPLYLTSSLTTGTQLSETLRDTQIQNVKISNELQWNQNREIKIVPPVLPISSWGTANFVFSALVAAYLLYSIYNFFFDKTKWTLFWTLLWFPRSLVPLLKYPLWISYHVYYMDPLRRANWYLDILRYWQS